MPCNFLKYCQWTFYDGNNKTILLGAGTTKGEIVKVFWDKLNAR